MIVDAGSCVADLPQEVAEVGGGDALLGNAAAGDQEASLVSAGDESTPLATPPVVPLPATPAILETPPAPAVRLVESESRLKAIQKEKQQCAIALAQALGLNLEDAKFLKEANDSLGVMAERLAADRMAQMILEAVHTESRRVTDLEVLSVLQAWAFKKNDTRQNVMPEGHRWVHSDTLGIVRLR